MTTRPALTFIGAGQMGLPMVSRLVGAGYAVTAYARRAEARAACEAAGAQATHDLRVSVGAADAVVVCVFSDEQLLELAVGPGGFLDAMAPGATLVIHTTGSPTTSRALAEHGASRRLRVVEAPVSGSAEDIAEGHVTVLLAGDDADVERARPIVSAYGDPVLHLGPLGSAQAVKLLNNALFAAQVQLVADVERLAGEMGADWATAAAAIRQSSGTSRALEIAAAMGSVDTLVDSDPLWPDAPESLLAQCEGAGLSDAEIDKVSWQNTARFFGYDPFAAIPREQATVGALRAGATDVDTSIVSRAEWRRRYEANPTYQAATT
jgi:3-hydroxyisobutyrate dehydrogenase-like beta-hydroxyacid dehydrogenase